MLHFSVNGSVGIASLIFRVISYSTACTLVPVLELTHAGFAGCIYGLAIASSTTLVVM